MSLPIPNPHAAVTMLAFFQGTQLNLFERFLTQAVAGIDSMEAVLAANLSGLALTTAITNGQDLLLYRTLDLPEDPGQRLAARVSRACVAPNAPAHARRW